MIVQLPPSAPEIPHLSAPPHYFTLTSLARRAGVARMVVLRQLAQGIVIPDGFIADGAAAQPIFLETRAVDVLKHAQTPKRPVVS